MTWVGNMPFPCRSLEAGAEVESHHRSPQPREDADSVEAQEENAKVGSSLGMVDAGPLDALPNQPTVEEIMVDPMLSQQLRKVSRQLEYFFCTILFSTYSHISMCNPPCRWPTTTS